MERNQEDSDNEIKQFEKADYEFMAYTYKELISLELGTESYYETDDMSDDEIEVWATEYGLLDDEEDDEAYYHNEDGSLDIDSLRAARREDEDENPSVETTPAGRAFQFFEEQCIDCPDDIEIDLIDSDHPGDNSYGVTVHGIDSIIKLQTFLFKKGVKVNFLFQDNCL